jgi:nucleoside-diphosphate-sugar epimerase
MPDVVAVTGATGFIGKHILASLIASGLRVRALSRQNRPSNSEIQWITGDLADQKALNDLVKGADIVIHCAGLVRGNNYEVFEQTNVTGTENLIQALHDQNLVPKLILISSLAAREPNLSWYARSKAKAEQVLIRSAQNINWTILRPTAVYGPADKELAPLFKATKSGILPIIGSAESKFGLIYVEDLVQAILLCISSTNVSGKTYELDDGTTGGYDPYIIKQIAEQVWGHKVRIISVPVLLISIIARMNLVLSQYLHYLPMLTPGKVRELNHHDWVCNIGRFVNDTGWRPKTLLKDGLEKAILS